MIPQRYWEPVSDVVWSAPVRAALVAGIGIYSVWRFGVAATGRATAFVAAVAAASWVIQFVWGRLSRTRRPA